MGPEVKLQKPAEVVHDFERAISDTDLDNDIDLEKVLSTLPHIKLRDGYTVGCYSNADHWGSIMVLYPFRKGATEQYGPQGPIIPPKRKPLSKLFNAFKDDETFLPFPDEDWESEDWENCVPFQDGQYIHGRIPFSDKINAPKLKDYLEIDFNPESVWESMLLLEESISYLKHGWHGDYNRGVLIVDNKSLALAANQAFDLRDHRWEMYLNKEVINPSVIMTSEIEAYVHYCRWSDWRGLDSIDLKVTREGRTVKFDREKPINLLEYNCGYEY